MLAGFGIVLRSGYTDAFSCSDGLTFYHILVHFIRCARSRLCFKPLWVVPGSTSSVDGSVCPFSMICSQVRQTSYRLRAQMQ